MTSFIISCTICGISAGTYNERKENGPQHTHGYTGTRSAVHIIIFPTPKEDR